ncbi:MAG: energy transducer TonB [Methyloprofundus sp.]|nr:energy transducer TonB [Methyloprofundus sp.]
MTRLLIALLSGTTIALLLFWGMQAMIRNNLQGIKETDNLVMTEFVRLKRDSQLQTKDRKIPKKPKPKQRPKQPTLKTQTAQVSQKAAPNMAMPKLELPLQASNFSGSNLSGIKMGLGQISTSVIPLVRIPPIYPRRAANRRIQGWVKIEFTITAEGLVKDPVVVQAKPSNVFNAAALKAIKRWKFKPHIIAGQAYEQRAAQTLEFKLGR